MNDEFDYGFYEDVAGYESKSQKARIWTENWIASQAYCPACGEDSLGTYPNNQPVADFLCDRCDEVYELKSTKSKFGKKLVDGAYSTMINRLRSNTVPNLMLLKYDVSRRCVTDLSVIPKQFFVTGVIEKRKPLGPTARRAGWVGCNILLNRIPQFARIHLIDCGKSTSRTTVLENWSKTTFLRKQNEKMRGWILDVWRCIEKIPSRDFAIRDIYAYEDELSVLYPDNTNIRPKIRQQLQKLRDAGFLEFIGHGHYRRLH